MRLKQVIVSSLLVGTIAISGCGADSVKEEKEIKSTGNVNEVDWADAFDYEELGVEPYTYAPSFDVFELSDVQKDAIVTLYEYSLNWNPSMAENDDWQEYYISNFVRMYRGGDYLKALYDRDGKASKEEAEYMQYSLTGQKISFNLDDGALIDIEDYSGFSPENTIQDYTYEGNSETILVHATIYHEHVSGEVIASDEYKVDVCLKRNPFSCYDGYYIYSIKDVTT
ncbi:hypothetical protein [Butyrivibrio sp. INlla14]|uniref:hypothetical protein n=1 Tax=Butyrivibrio sp. INlla14 TaxID=1520808 RepID=UPI0008768832|nr:hypothetical protein [Butyrivibrio sp. INlla14]SCY65721.1 hypothetical protein SAMN02910371_03238 [Butyrivibrio sp. INlla14]